MNINFTLVILATIAQFILGALWYSPLLFGKWWMEIMEMTKVSKEELKKLQQGMGPFYLLQLLLSFTATATLAYFSTLISDFNIYYLALTLWLGFIIPTQISGVIWANTKKKYWLKQIFIMATNQLCSVLLAALILSF